MNYLDMVLDQYSRTDFYPFHMPGHKRQVHTEYLSNPYAVDITEITDFDNLHHAEGIIKENQDMAAELYRADKTWFLINGSTAGILQQYLLVLLGEENFLWQETVIRRYTMLLI